MRTQVFCLKKLHDQLVLDSMADWSPTRDSTLNEGAASGPCCQSIMPPKKKKRYVKDGLCRQHLSDNFSVLPSVGEELLNGHVLYIYIEKERVISSTIKAFGHLSSQDIALYQVVKVCKALDKFRHMSDDNEFKNFAALCREKFPLSKNVKVVPSSDHSSEHVASASSESVVASASSESVVASASSEPVVASASSEPVVASASSEPVVASASSEPVVASASSEPVVASASSEPVVASASSEPVVASASSEPVVASASSEPVVASASSEPVVASASSEPVVASASSEPVVASASSEPVD